MTGPRREQPAVGTAPTHHTGVDQMPIQAQTFTERIDVHGGHLLEKIRELVHEGNVRRILITDADGKTVMEMPVTVGVVGILAAPSMAAIGALAAIAADYSIEVERENAQPAGSDPAASA